MSDRQVSRRRRTTASRRPRSRRRLAHAFALTSGFLGIVAIGASTGAIPIWVLTVHAAMSAAAFLAYGADKAAAVRGRQRTRESTLHLLALAGGWPGALVARQYYRHKTIKEPFRTIFWLTVAANCAALGGLVIIEPLTMR